MDSAFNVDHHVKAFCMSCLSEKDSWNVILQHDRKPYHCIGVHILYLHPYHNTNKVSIFVAWLYERKSRRTRTNHTWIITRITLQLFFNFVTSIYNQDTPYLFSVDSNNFRPTWSSFLRIMKCTLYNHILVSKQWYYEHILNSKNQFSIYIIYTCLLVR